jgi:hypothetical protein
MNAPRRLPIRIVVSDTGPLISLAACNRLALLGEFNRPVAIPDVVKAECLRHPAKVGAETLAAWFAAPECPIEVLRTPVMNVWENAVAADEADPTSRESTGIGDAAMAWLLSRTRQGLALNEPTLVLTEDGPFGDGILRDQFPEVHVLSTRAFPRTLENFGRIPSAEAVIAEIADAGRKLARYLADRPGQSSRGTKTTWAEVMASGPVPGAHTGN